MSTGAKAGIIVLVLVFLVAGAYLATGGFDFGNGNDPADPEEPQGPIVITVVANIPGDPSFLQFETDIVPECEFAWENHSFISWKDSKGNVYNPGDIVTKKISLYAKWALLGQLTLDPNGGEGDVQYYENVTKVPDWKPVKDGYEFNGWTDSEGKKYAIGSDVPTNATLYAQWIFVKYELVILPGFEGGQQYRQGYALYPTGEVYDRPGHVFKGWLDESGKIHQPGDEVMASMTVTAVWA